MTPTYRLGYALLKGSEEMVWRAKRAHQRTLAVINHVSGEERLSKAVEPLHV
jgi:hypothetical protein